MSILFLKTDSVPSNYRLILMRKIKLCDRDVIVVTCTWQEPQHTQKNMYLGVNT